MIIDNLKVALANHVESALIVQSYHWCIEGPDFNQYHSFFGEIYAEYFDQVDRLAEYIRIVSDSSEYVNASVEVIKVNKTVKAKILVGNKPIEMTKEILILNEELLNNFKALTIDATCGKFDGLANYCADQIDALSKLKWKLTAITK